MLAKTTLKDPSESIEKKAKDCDFIRVFLNDQKDGTFICPACNNGVIKHLGEFSQSNKAIRLICTCKCGHVYRVLVERRRFFRKPVNLVGIYCFNEGENNPRKGPIKILDVSQSGLQFSLNSVPEFKVGDRIVVEFRMDDRDRSRIREMGTVKDIRSNRVGLQFDTVDPNDGLGLCLIKQSHPLSVR
jgi:hypothetical protein